jgi:hypothetical protein
MTHIIFALINGLHNNKLETSVVQLFELIELPAADFQIFPKPGDHQFQVWGWRQGGG